MSLKMLWRTFQKRAMLRKLITYLRYLGHRASSAAGNSSATTISGMSGTRISRIKSVMAIEDRIREEDDTVKVLIRFWLPVLCPAHWRSFS